jgi:hypothetical protein
MQMICQFDSICERYDFLKKIQNENKNELQMNFLFDLMGQIIRCMFIGGLFIN